MLNDGSRGLERQFRFRDADRPQGNDRPAGLPQVEGWSPDTGGLALRLSPGCQREKPPPELKGNGKGPEGGAVCRLLDTVGFGGATTVNEGRSPHRAGPGPSGLGSARPNPGGLAYGVHRQHDGTTVRLLVPRTSARLALIPNQPDAGSVTRRALQCGQLGGRRKSRVESQRRVSAP